MKNLKGFLPVVIIILLSFWAIKPFIGAGFFPMHDDTQVARVFEMKKALADGAFPVRWVQDLGYGFGYPIFNFYAPFAYYIGAVFNLIGFNSLDSTKIMMVLGIILSGIFMYFLAKEFWGKSGGVVSGILYVYAPYHALDVYVRGDVAEFWAYSFIPLVFFGIYKTYLSLDKYIRSATVTNKKNKETVESNINNLWLYVSITAAAYAAIILSHNLTAMMVTPAIFLFAVILYASHRMNDRIHKPYLILAGLLLGIAISAFYWLPVFPEIKYTNVLSVVGGGSAYKDHFVCIKQLWNSPWGYGGSVPGCVDGLSFRIGKIHILLTLLSIYALFISYKKSKTRFVILSFFGISLLIYLFLMIKESKFIWDMIPHMAFFQFPWRFLLLVSFYTSFFGGAVLSYVKSYNDYIRSGLAVLIVGCILFFNSKLFVPQKIKYENSEKYTSKFALSWTASNISDEYMPKNFAKPTYSGSVPNSKLENNINVKIISEKDKSQQLSIITQVTKNTDLFVNTAYFPAWHVFVDEHQVDFKYSGDGIYIPLEKGKHVVDMKFMQTTVERWGNVISIAGAAIIFLGFIYERRKYHK